MKIACGFCIVLISVASYTGDPKAYFCTPSNNELETSDTLSVSDLLHKARNRSVIQAFDSKIRSNKLLESAALSGYCPHLNIATCKTIGNLGTYQTNVEVEQLLLSFAGPIEEYKIARQDTAISQFEQMMEQSAIRLELEQQLLDWWLLEHKRPAMTSLSKVADALLASDRRSYEVGFSSDPLWFADKALYIERTTTVQKYPDELTQNRFDLERSIEMPLRQPINETSVAQLLERSLTHANALPLEQYIEQAIVTRNILHKKDAEILQQHYYENYYRRSYLPKASLFASVYSSNQLDTDIDVVTSSNLEYDHPSSKTWRMGIRFCWDFDGFGNAFQSDSSKNLTIALALEKQNLIHSIKLDVQNAFTEIKKLAKDLDASYANLKAVESGYQASVHKHTIGLISDNDLTEAENEHENALFAVNTAKVLIAQKYRELLYHCGYSKEIEKV